MGSELEEQNAERQRESLDRYQRDIQAMRDEINELRAAFVALTNKFNDVQRTVIMTNVGSGPTAG